MNRQKEKQTGKRKKGKYHNYSSFIYRDEIYGKNGQKTNTYILYFMKNFLYEALLLRYNPECN